MTGAEIVAFILLAFAFAMLSYEVAKAFRS